MTQTLTDPITGQSLPANTQVDELGIPLPNIDPNASLLSQLNTPAKAPSSVPASGNPLEPDGPPPPANPQAPEAVSPAPVPSQTPPARKFKSWEEAERAHLEAMRKISEQGEELHHMREQTDTILRQAEALRMATQPPMAPTPPPMDSSTALRKFSEDPLGLIKEAIQGEVGILAQAVLAVNEKLTAREVEDRRDGYIEQARGSLTVEKDRQLFDQWTDDGTFAKLSEEFHVNPDLPETPRMMFEIAKGRMTQSASAQLAQLQQQQQAQVQRGVIEQGGSGSPVTGLDGFAKLSLEEMEARLKSLGA